MSLEPAGTFGHSAPAARSSQANRRISTTRDFARAISTKIRSALRRATRRPPGCALPDWSAERRFPAQRRGSRSRSPPRLADGRVVTTIRWPFGARRGAITPAGRTSGSTLPLRSTQTSARSSSGAIPPVDIDQSPLCRDGELTGPGVRTGVPIVRRLHDPVNHGDRRPCQRQSHGIERDGHQRPSADEHEMPAGHVPRVRAIVEQDLLLARDERPYDDLGIVPPHRPSFEA